MNVRKYIKEVGPAILFLLLLHLLNPFDMGHFFGYLLFAVFVISKKSLIAENMDQEFMILVLFGFIYTLFNAQGDNKGFQYLIIQAVFPCFFYLLGRTMVFKEMTRKQIVFFLFSIVFIFSLTSIVSVVQDLLRGGFVQSSRLIRWYWTGKWVKATGVAGYLTYNMVIPAILFASRRSYFQKAILLGIYMISMLCVFRLGSRTALAITGLTIAIGLFVYFTQNSIRTNLKFIVRMTIFLVILLNFFPINLEADYFSTLGARLQSSGTSSASSAGGRTELWIMALENFIESPLGWDARRHSHNVWLDIAKVGGIIPFILFIIFNIKNLINVRRLFKLNRDEDSLEINMTFTLFTAGALIYFFVEPVLEGSFYAITFYCSLQGILKGYLVQQEKIDYEVKSVETANL